MNIVRGFRGKLQDYLDTGQPVQVRICTTGSAVYDSCCFGVDAADKLSDDRYMIFYNQKSSPGQEITYAEQGNAAVYQIRLSALPEKAAKLVFTVSIDGNGTMGEIASCVIDVMQNGNTVLQLSLTEKDFQSEKAVIGIEIYQKSGWRISAVARGFNGGLGDLLKSYGGEIAGEAPKDAPASSPAAVAPAPAVKAEDALTNKIMNRISLSEDKVSLEKHVVNLSKCVVDLSKKSSIDLGNTVVKVVVALDFSGSMDSLYKKGIVQNTINRLVPLGLTFDDNGSIDMFLFQSDFRRMPDLNLSNYENYVSQVIFTSGYRMGGTNYAPVLQAIIEGVKIKTSGGLFSVPKFDYIPPIVDDGVPTLILFITDGENMDRDDSDTIIRKSSDMNVFIQFIGIGNDNFKYLMQLDDMPGRKRDNTGFSRMKDLASADDRQLYTNVLEQFANWLKGLQ